MRILHVITSLYSGGAEKLVVELIPRFLQQGHEVGVVVFNGRYTPLMERLEKECPECKIYKLGVSFYNPYYILKLISIMRKYDIVHSHNSSPQLYTAIANVFCGKKLVTTEHNTNNRKRNNRFLADIDKWMYTRYGKVICISDQAEKNLREYLDSKEDKRNICTIYNGIDIATFQQATPLKEHLSTKFVIVMVASFRPQKDQDTLIRMMKLLPNDSYELWLVGDGERRDIIEKEVKRQKLQDVIKFWGLRTDIPQILKTADVVVMSTHYEGLSLSNIEGMAVGKPFVASDVEGIHEVTDGYGILFPHEDVEVLAKIIQRLHDDRQYYQETADRCYERAKQFDISKMVKQYNEIYLTLSKHEA